VAWRKFVGYQAIEEPSVKVRKKSGMHKGYGAHGKRKDTPGGNDQRSATTMQGTAIFEGRGGDIGSFVLRVVRAQRAFQSGQELIE
jgi:hypothetical protein